MSEITIKINKPFKYLDKQYAVDEEVPLQVDTEGTPLVLFWRNRLIDSKIDHCITVIKDKESKRKELK